MDTIYALATARGKAGVAIVRVSGDQARKTCDLFRFSIPDRGRAVRYLLDNDGSKIDQVLVLHFPNGSSFTGEEVVELHLHGSSAIVRVVMDRLSTVAGFRLADPGEFTRRAFDNGMLDLTQVEGLADLIDAETESQRRQALKIFEGELSQKAESWRESLLKISALFSASIDFSDEDIPDQVIDDARGLLVDLRDGLDLELRGFGAAERIRDGFEVAILGAPNVGKSTLLNRLAGRDAAIVSDIAGTTRDVVEVHMDLHGLSVTFLDTAGLRESVDPIEKIGVNRAKERAQRADLRIWLGQDPQIGLDIDDIIVDGKSDLRSDGAGVSGLTGAGVDQLIDQVVKVLSNRVDGAGVVVNERHKTSVQLALASIEECLSILETTGDIIISAELVNSAARQMQSLLGRVDVEAILGEIFSSFCIGK